MLIDPDDHHHDDDEEEDGDHGEGAEAGEDDEASPKSTFKVDEIIPIVDSILEQDDKVQRNVFFSLLEIDF